MVDLEEEYPSIVEARACANQGEYEHAIALYTEILNGLNPDEESVPYIYLEYSNVLLKNSNEYFMKEYENIASHSQINLSDRNNIEDDLECAWNFTEAAANAFRIMKDNRHLAKSHALLGDILLINNHFKDAIFEFTEALTLMNVLYDQYDVVYVEVYMSMASAYEFLCDYDMGIMYYEKVVEIYRKNAENCIDQSDLENFKMFESDILSRIEVIKGKKAAEKNVDAEFVEEEESDGGDAIDINNLKKRID